MDDENQVAAVVHCYQQWYSVIEINISVNNSNNTIYSLDCNCSKSSLWTNHTFLLKGLECTQEYFLRSKFATKQVSVTDLECTMLGEMKVQTSCSDRSRLGINNFLSLKYTEMMLFFF